MAHPHYATEWCLLQNQFESYEKHSLYIKLSSIFLVLFAATFNVSTILTSLLLLVLWIQDAIWKTFQSRIEPRLMKIEKSLIQEDTVPEFQFNSDYQLVATSGLAKLMEYGRQSIRPTIAFPYIALLVVSVLFDLIA